MENLEIYQLSMRLSQRGWELVNGWPHFAKDTIGKQLVRAFDSISANIAEGTGRYYFKDRNLFYVYARGSLHETKCWLEKAKERGLINSEDCITIIRELNRLNFQINQFITKTRHSSKE